MVFQMFIGLRLVRTEAVFQTSVIYQKNRRLSYPPILGKDALTLRNRLLYCTLYSYTDIHLSLFIVYFVGGI
jgi:hypothetical protein